MNDKNIQKRIKTQVQSIRFPKEFICISHYIVLYQFDLLDFFNSFFSQKVVISFTFFVFCFSIFSVLILEFIYNSTLTKKRNEKSPIITKYVCSDENISSSPPLKSEYWKSNFTSPEMCIDELQVDVLLDREDANIIKIHVRQFFFSLYNI